MGHKIKYAEIEHHESLIANTVTTAVTVGFAIVFALALGHCTVRMPSLPVSQKHEVEELRPAPFFCISTQFTMYLKGLLSNVNFSMTSSQILLDQTLERLSV